MKVLVLTNWKRWVATFCVALVALVLVGRVYAGDRDCSAQWPSSYSVASLANEDGQRQDPSSGFAAHHCCSAHVANLAQLLPRVGLIVQSSSDVELPVAEGKAPRERPGGFDRPPRFSAHA